jgi:hypothetical protein
MKEFDLLKEELYSIEEIKPNEESFLDGLLDIGTKALSFKPESKESERFLSNFLIDLYRFAKKYKAKLQELNGKESYLTYAKDLEKDCFGFHDFWIKRVEELEEEGFNPNYINLMKKALEEIKFHGQEASDFIPEIVNSYYLEGKKKSSLKRIFSIGEEGKASLKKILAGMGILSVIAAATGAVYYSKVYKPHHTDSDNDGISDWDEVHKFKTNPHNEDTDGDYIIDSQDPHPLKFDFWRVDFKENGRSVDKYSTPQTWDDVELISYEELRKRIEDPFYGIRREFFPPDKLIQIVENKVNKLTDNGKRILPDTVITVADLISKEIKNYEDKPKDFVCVDESYWHVILMNKTFVELGLNARAWNSDASHGEVKGPNHAIAMFCNKNTQQLYLVSIIRGVVPFENSIYIIEPGTTKFYTHALEFDEAVEKWGESRATSIVDTNFLNALYNYEPKIPSVLPYVTYERAKWLANYMRAHGFDNRLYQQARKEISIIEALNSRAKLTIFDRKRLLYMYTGNLLILGKEDPIYLVIDVETWKRIDEGDKVLEKQLEEKYL